MARWSSPSLPGCPTCQSRAAESRTSGATGTFDAEEPIARYWTFLPLPGLGIAEAVSRALHAGPPLARQETQIG